MPNDFLTTATIAKEALIQLENQLVAAKLVNRRYEAGFARAKDGNTIRVRRPNRYNVRTGPTASPQDTEEGNISVVVDRQRGVDLSISSADMTLTIDRLSELYIRPAMMELAQQVDADVLSLYPKIANWVGATGQQVNSWSDYAKAPERLDEIAVPRPNRVGILHTTDYWGVVGSMTATVFNERIVKSAVEDAKVGRYADTDVYLSQNVVTHTNGAFGGSPVTNTSTQPTSWAAVKGTTPIQQTIAVTAASLSTTGWANAGDVFTIADVLDINPRNRATLGRLKQFAVQSVANSDGSGNVTLTITPAIIPSGPHRNCILVSPGAGKALTFVGAGGATNRANIVMHKDALGLVMVPMELPAGAVNPARETYRDISLRVIPVYDGANDVNLWRIDMLYGVEAYYPELATRLTGTS